METKERVIVIDLVGSGEETVVKAEKAGDHECTCGVCTCKDERKREPEQLELQLQTIELPARVNTGPVASVSLPPALRLAAAKRFIH